MAAGADTAHQDVDLLEPVGELVAQPGVGGNVVRGAVLVRAVRRQGRAWSSRPPGSSVYPGLAPSGLAQKPLPESTNGSLTHITGGPTSPSGRGAPAGLVPGAGRLQTREPLRAIGGRCGHGLCSPLQAWRRTPESNYHYGA